MLKQDNVKGLFLVCFVSNLLKNLHLEHMVGPWLKLADAKCEALTQPMNYFVC